MWGVQAGRGKLLGEVMIEAGSSPNEFRTKATWKNLTTGATFSRTGKANLYTGYAWRGRSTFAGAATLENPKEMREVLTVSRDQSKIEGRWYWGGYDELGIDVTMVRSDGMPSLLGIDKRGLQTGTRNTLTLYGDSLPARVDAAQVNFGSGVKVVAARLVSPQSLSVDVEVAADAVFGPRDAQIGRLVLPKAVAVYDQVDYIKVGTEHALARLGGGTFPKGYIQFEALSYHRGLDGKPFTPDDIQIGPADVAWSMEEFLARFDDDDKEYVGTLNDSGFFTPAIDGPNPKRRFGTNNFGDVWVVATFRGKTRDGKPAVAKSYLVTTVPLYMRWDNPEISQ